MARFFTRMFSRSDKGDAPRREPPAVAVPAAENEPLPAPPPKAQASKAQASKANAPKTPAPTPLHEPPAVAVPPAKKVTLPPPEPPAAAPVLAAECGPPAAPPLEAPPAGAPPREARAAAAPPASETPPPASPRDRAPARESPRAAAPTRPSRPQPAPASPAKQLTSLRWGPENGRSVDTIVFMCHGMASSANGIIQIAPQLGSVLPGALFVAPNGPEPADSGTDARLWFDARDRSPAALEAGVRTAAAALNDVIDAELDRVGLSRDAYALAGYSQGAMTALFAGLRRNPGPRAILCYAGALIAPHKLADEMACRAPVMLVHGLADPVVPAFYSRDAEKALRASRIPVQGVYVPRLGHTIDAPALQAGKQFLLRCLRPNVAAPRTASSLADG
jgi:phospholipase/carboxylesterase